MSHTMLKIKLKTLAAEAKIIRHQEAKMVGPNWFSKSIKYTNHRKYVVRPEARATHIAYGLLRGLDYVQIEPSAKTTPDWKAVERMVKKYGTAKDLEQFQILVEPTADKAA